MSKKIAMPGRGERINSTEKSLISNIYKYFKSQVQGPSGSSILKVTMEATGFCRSTVCCVLDEYSCKYM